MQNTSINIPYYTPAEPPDNSDMARYLREELFKARAAIDLLAGGKLPVTAVEPTKPRDGDIKIADGVMWGDAGITIDTVSNQGSTSPAARLTYECIKCIEI